MSEWRGKAACRDADPDAEGFFALRLERSHAVAALNAITTYCAVCPSKQPCLDEARETGDMGVRGGLVRPEPWAKNGQQELTVDDLRQIIFEGRSTVEGPQCPACDRRGLKLRPNGEIGRHVDYVSGSWCEGVTEGVA